MIYLLVIAPLFISFFGIFYYILIGNNIVNSIRFFIPLTLLTLVADAIVSIVMYAYGSDIHVMATFTFIFLIVSLLILFLFLYTFIKKLRLSNGFLWINVFLIFVVTTILIIYSSSPNFELQQLFSLLTYICLFALSLMTLSLGFIIYHRYIIMKNDTILFQLIRTLSILFVITWLFLIIWLIMRNEVKSVFYEVLFIFSKLMLISFSLAFYFYLFELYKKKIRKEKLSRLKGFVKINGLSLPTETELSFMENIVKPVATNDAKYQKSQLNSKKLNEYKNRIEVFFNNNRNIYIDTEFNMSVLSSQTEIPRYHLSQVFSVAFQTSFSEYVSNKRIIYACELMKETGGKLTITELSEKCGFRSRASFYHHFKKIMGFNPGEYNWNNDVQI